MARAISSTTIRWNGCRPGSSAAWRGRPCNADWTSPSGREPPSLHHPLADLDAELTDPMPQAALADAERLGGADLDIVVALQRPQDDAFLDPRQFAVEIGRHDDRL